jgi:hypothetical protein
MARLSTCLKILSLCVLTHVGLAAAQHRPSEAPPKLERIEPGSDVPATTVPQRGGTRITEKRDAGQTKEVTVQSGRSTYVMRPNVPAGNAQPGDAQSSAIRAPQWQVMEFDLGKKKQGAADAAPAEEADVPPPPRPASTR